MRSVIALFGIGLASWVGSVNGAVDIPDGWRFPTKSELASDAERKGSPSGYTQASADLNGDGVPDQAFLLKSTRFSGEALWVRLSGEDGQFSCKKLAEIRWGAKYPHVDLSMGIEIVKPGVIAYGCFDEAKECNFGAEAVRPKLKLKHPGLMYFKPGSAASMYFWSAKHKRFLKVWLSD